MMITHELPKSDRPGSMAPAARQIQSLRDIGIDIEVVELRGRQKWKYFPALANVYRKLGTVDLVHAHFGYCAWLARLQFTKPVVVSFMGDDLLGTVGETGTVKPLSKVVVQINRFIARTADAVIVKSAGMAQVIQNIPANIVPNGVDIDIFHPIPRQEAKQRLNWDLDKHYILLPGNPNDPNKGYALASASTKYAQTLTHESLELVALHKVSPDDVPLYMNACSVMIMASFSEGSPNVVKEAMACNTPIISVDVGDTVQTLAGVAGCTIAPRDPEIIGEMIVNTIRHTPTSGGRDAIISRKLDLVNVAERIVEIYRNLYTE
jgi:glycosyltransferase involved in cell wall biosynthesis